MKSFKRIELWIYNTIYLILDGESVQENILTWVINKNLKPKQVEHKSNMLLI